MARRALRTKEEFSTYIKEVKASTKGYRDPLAFGIARVDRGQKNHDKILQAVFPVVNWKENLGSAAIFIGALKEAGVEVDFSDSEFVCDATKEFVENAIALCSPYVEEAIGENQKIIKTFK